MASSVQTEKPMIIYRHNARINGLIRQGLEEEQMARDLSKGGVHHWEVK